jgi:hypothetical protein
LLGPAAVAVIRPDRQPGASPVERVSERRSRRRIGPVVVLLVFVAGGALFLHDVVLPPARQLWQDEIAPRLAGQPPASARRVPSPTEAADPGRVPPVVHREELLEALQRPRAVAADLPVRLSAGFRPAGFRIAAQSHPLALSPEPPPGSKPPPTTGGRAGFGLLRLQGGRDYLLALVEDGGAYRLYVDRNRNGDLGDDGPPLANEGSGGFAASLRLPLREVTGQPLDGASDLWIYRDERRADRLHVYARTQLAGALTLGGRRVPAVVADNVVLDADYTNDGIALDLDGDGQFKGSRELVAPGGTVEVDGAAYRLRVVW